MSERGDRPYVDMAAVLEAMATVGADAPRFLLDRESGLVVLELEGGPGEEEAGRYLEIPRMTEAEQARARAGFVATVDEEAVRVRLAQALSGPRVFLAALAALPDLRARWSRERQAQLLGVALAWLSRQGIEPQYDLPTLEPAPSPVEAGPPAVGLLDLLLLGGAGAELPHDAARVTRVLRAADDEQAHQAFVRIARELAAQTGHRGRWASDDDDAPVELGRFHLRRQGRQVVLEVDVPPAIGRHFGRVK